MTLRKAQAVQLLPPLCSRLPEYKQLLPKAGYRIASADEAGEKVEGEKKYEKSAGCDRISHVSGGIAQRWQRFLAGRMIAPIDKLVDNNV